jgi:hypothetical protein
MKLNTTTDSWSAARAEHKRGLHVARSLTGIKFPEAHIQECNVTDKLIQPNEGQTVSPLHPVDVLNEVP